MNPNALSVTADFSSAHFYAQPAWSEEKNRAEFGRCYTPYGHGHNYRARATFRTADSPSPTSEDLARALAQAVRPLDHEHLNFVIPEFKTLVPTTENIALWIWRRLQASPHGGRLERLRVFETEDLWVEIEA